MNRRLEFAIAHDGEGKWWAAYSLDGADRVLCGGPYATEALAAQACIEMTDDVERDLRAKGIIPLSFDYCGGRAG
jgi:hypothetical protein